MEKNQWTVGQVARRPHQTPQLRLRTDLRSGGDVDDCMKAMKDWQSSYNKWYDKVNATKPTPCNNL
jgi:hypothetical protein